MKIYISCDMEGLSGICEWEETEIGKPGYGYFTERMNNEVGSICNAINRADSEALIYVKDAHESGRNLDHAKLPRNVILNRGWAISPYSMMYGIDQGFDASIFSAYHSASGTNTNPMAHTMDSKDIIYMKINGRIASEFLFNYYSSIYNKVPLVMVTGDEGLCKAVKEIDPNIHTVASFVGVGGSVTSEHPEEIYKKIQETTERAIADRHKMSLELPAEFKVEIYYRYHVQALKHSYYPGAYAISDHIVGFSCTDYFEFLRFFMFK